MHKQETPTKLLRLMIAVILMTVTMPGVCSAQSSTDREYDIKAACIFNLLKFTSFPDNSFTSKQPSIQICIVGKDYFGSKIDKTFKNKKIGGKSVVIDRVSSINDIKKKYHVVFASKDLDISFLRTISQLKTNSFLLISDRPDFCQNGGAINIRIEDNKIRFDANPESITNSGATVSSQFLKLADIVKQQAKQ